MLVNANTPSIQSDGHHMVLNTNCRGFKAKNVTDVLYVWSYKVTHSAKSQPSQTFAARASTYMILYSPVRPEEVFSPS